MNEMLNDKKIYKKLDRDPPQSMERKMNALLLNLSKRGDLSQKISTTVYAHLMGSLHFCMVYPRHKNLVFHYVPVSFVHSLSYQLSKHPAKLLSPTAGNHDSHVLNSSEFVTFIRFQMLQLDEVLVSFDVVSLFKNILVKLGHDITCCRVRTDYPLVTY